MLTDAEIPYLEADYRLCGGTGLRGMRFGPQCVLVDVEPPGKAVLLCLLSSFRCLDEAEKAPRPTAPQIPECPICGKPFLTPKSRISHMKKCAVKMEVGPQLLLQAVRLQAAQSEGASGTLAQASR